MSIVSDQILHLSDPTQSNDPNELVHFWNLVEEVWQRQNGWNSVQIEQCIDESIGLVATNRLDRCFTLSLSEKGDELSQWRGYADNGAGAALEFCLKIPESPPSRGVSLPRKSYLRQERRIKVSQKIC